MTTIPVVCVVGRSGVGKTTLLEKLIPELKRRGYRVATVKHHAHPASGAGSRGQAGFEIDQPGKDTWRHAQAGSDHVVIVDSDRVASIRHVEREPSLDEIAAMIRDVDIILTEGYKRANRPKIEVLRAARGSQPICTPEELLALVSDLVVPIDVPHFDLDDAVGLADLLEDRFLRQPGPLFSRA